MLSSEQQAVSRKGTHELNRVDIIYFFSATLQRVYRCEDWLTQGQSHGVCASAQECGGFIFTSIIFLLSSTTHKYSVLLGWRK